MSKTVAKSASQQANHFDLDSWLLGAGELESDAVALLTAYRVTAETARQSLQAASAPEAGDGESSESDEESAPATVAFVSRTLPAVPRLRNVDGIEPERLASLHGQLLAGGYLTAEVLGRTDGLAYAITRDGLRHLNGETTIADVA